MLDSRPGYFNGMRVVVVPAVITVARTWVERLFSWPWRPLVREKIMANPDCPPDDQLLCTKSTIFCSAGAYHALRQTLATKEEADHG